jgi:isopentenyldiphosphate isomerase
MTSASTNNPHALNKAQDDNEMFEVMKVPPIDFDMFHDRPESTGLVKARHLVHRDQNWHRSVHVWIVDPLRKLVVLQKRSPQKDTFPNRWDISSAGHIEVGQDSKATAVREVAEELGIQVKDGSGGTCNEDDELIFAFTCPAPQAPQGCNCYEDVYFLTRDKDHCKFAIGEAEVTEVRWVEIERLKQALENEESDYVPRVAAYRIAFFKKLDSICGSV